MVYFSTLASALLPAAIVGAAAVPVSDDLSIRSTQIYGGTLVPPEEFHALAQVQASIPGGFIGCGGTLVSKNLVVTAAHCVKDSQPNGVRVLVGTHDLSKGGTVAGVSQIMLNGRFEDIRDPDIVLLRLSQDSSQTLQIGYAKLPAQGSDPLGGDPGLAAGWGNREDGSVPTKAYKTTLPFINHTDCRAKYGQVPDFALCVGGESNGHGTCGGDTGGPLLNQRNGNFVGVCRFIVRYSSIENAPAFETAAAAAADVNLMTTLVAHDKAHDTARH